MPRLTSLLLMAALLPAPAWAQDSAAKTAATRKSFQTFCDTGVALGIAALVQEKRLPAKDLLALRQRISASGCAKVPTAQVDELMTRQGSLSLARNVGAMSVAQASGLEGADRDRYVEVYGAMLKDRGSFGLRAQENFLTHLEETEGGTLAPKTPTPPTEAQRLDTRFVQMCVAGVQGAHQVYRLDAVGQVKPAPDDARLQTACRQLIADASVREEWLTKYTTKETRDVAACVTGAWLSWRALGIEPDANQSAETARLCDGYTLLPAQG